MVAVHEMDIGVMEISLKPFINDPSMADATPVNPMPFVFVVIVNKMLLQLFSSYVSFDTFSLVAQAAECSS